MQEDITREDANRVEELIEQMEDILHEAESIARNAELSNRFHATKAAMEHVIDNFTGFGQFSFNCLLNELNEIVEENEAMAEEEEEE